MCDKILERYTTQLLNSHRDLNTDQCMYTIKVQLAEIMSLWGVGVGGDYLQEYGWRINFRGRNAPLKPILARVRALRARTLEHSAQPLGGSVNWRLSFPSGLVGLNLFQAAQLDPVSSRQLVWSRGLFWSLTCLRATLSSFTVYCGIEELSEYDQIQGHSEAILVDFLPV